MQRFNGKTIAFGFLVGVIVSSTVTSQDIPNRKEIRRIDLTGAPGIEVITLMSEYRPGEAIPAHSHHGVETVYVTQGATLQQPGKEPIQIPTGATMMNLRDVVHGGSTVVGNSSFKFYSVHIVDKGKPLYDMVKR